MCYNRDMGKIGQIPWNKGRRNPYSKETLESMRLSKLSPVSTEKIIELYQQGKSCNDVAQLLDTSNAVVWRRLRPTGMLRDRGYANRGKKLSPERCKAISEGQKKLRNNPIDKERLCMGKNNPFYGHKHKLETIEAMKLKLSKLFLGENNPQWQGGKSFEPYTSTFKRIIRHQVYERDKYQCQQCGITHGRNTGRLVAHHKDANKPNCALENLITFCRPCHGRITMGARWSKEVVKIL